MTNGQLILFLIAKAGQVIPGAGFPAAKIGGADQLCICSSLVQPPQYIHLGKSVNGRFELVGDDIILNLTLNTGSVDGHEEGR